MQREQVGHRYTATGTRPANGRSPSPAWRMPPTRCARRSPKCGRTCVASVPRRSSSGGWDSSTVALVANEPKRTAAVTSTCPPPSFPTIRCPTRPLTSRPWNGDFAAPQAAVRAGALRCFDDGDGREQASLAPRRPAHGSRHLDAPGHAHGDGGNETLGGMFPSGPAMLADAFLDPSSTCDDPRVAGRRRPTVRATAAASTDSRRAVRAAGCVAQS